MEKCRGTRTEKGRRSTRGSALELEALLGNGVATQELDQAMEGRDGVAVVEGQVAAEGAELRDRLEVPDSDGNCEAEGEGSTQDAGQVGGSRLDGGEILQGRGAMGRGGHDCIEGMNHCEEAGPGKQMEERTPGHSSWEGLSAGVVQRL